MIVGVPKEVKTDEYRVAIVPDGATIWQQADLVVKFKEPLPEEWPLMRPGQIVFTYFHFAASEDLTRAVMQSGVTAIAYETIKDAKGTLPLLTPMSEVAGRMSIQEGAKYLERPFDGRGILLAGVPGVLPANVLIPGAKTPRLVRRADLKRMPPRAVIIDVAIDQGGCVETSHPTTHSNPVY